MMNIGEITLQDVTATVDTDDKGIFWKSIIVSLNIYIFYIISMLFFYCLFLAYVYFITTN